VEGSSDAVNLQRSSFYVGNRSARRKGILARQPRPQAGVIGALRGSDLTVIRGKQDQLVGRILERYGVAKDEAERRVKTRMNRM
jgi:uncharacterized protein YjbJ (UPF0337 family)